MPTSWVSVNWKGVALPKRAYAEDSTFTTWDDADYTPTFVNPADFIELDVYMYPCCGIGENQFEFNNHFSLTKCITHAITHLDFVSEKTKASALQQMNLAENGGHPTCYFGRSWKKKPLEEQTALRDACRFNLAHNFVANEMASGSSSETDDDDEISVSR